jgi:hypothetical protein
MTAHDFILEAMAKKVEQVDHHAVFHAVADQRYANLVAAGETIPWEEMRGDLEYRILGETGAHAVGRKRLSREWREPS